MRLLYIEEPWKRLRAGNAEGWTGKGRLGMGGGSQWTMCGDAGGNIQGRYIYLDKTETSAARKFEFDR